MDRARKPKFDLRRFVTHPGAGLPQDARITAYVGDYKLAFDLTQERMLNA